LNACLINALQGPGVVKLSIKWTDSSAAPASQAGSANSDKDNKDKGKYYSIQRCTNANCTFPSNGDTYKKLEAKALGQPGKAGLLEWTDTSIRSRETYCYRVMTCLAEKLCSAWSATALCGAAI
jgi:hypothetical protein